MPPYSDNLYSADDADADADAQSFSDELSPTDGYFTNSNPSQARMVPDPSLQTRHEAAAAKAREAAEEGQATSAPLSISTQGPSSVFNTSRSPRAFASRSPTSPQRRREDLYSESSSLLHAGVPPPAYSPSTVQPVDQSFNRNYSTIPARQLEDGIREPERMGPPDNFNERTPLWLKRAKRVPRRRVIQNILFAALVVVLVVTFVVAIVKASKSSHESGSDPSKSPITRPGGGEGPYCASTNMFQVDNVPTYEFRSGKELAVLQINDESNLGRGRGRISTAGEIIVRRLPEEKEDQETGYLTIDIWVSDHGIQYKIEMDEEAQALKVTTPEYADLSPSRDHCISIEITIWVPPNASFETTLIEATELSLRVLDDANCQVSGEAQFASYSGSIFFPAIEESSVQPSASENSLASIDSSGFSAGDIIIETSSGSVRGAFKLYNHLQIETQSGTIDISVAPQPGSDDEPKPAELTLATASGSIRTRFPIRDPAAIPDRDYRSSVSSHSGTISGDYVLGSEAKFRCISGTLDITAIPTTFNTCLFSTETTSGSTKITVLPPLYRKQSSSTSQPIKYVDAGDSDPYLISDASASASALTHLKSTHSGSSGSMKIQYPSAWEGEITAQTISGNIKVGGDGVRTIKDSRKNWAFHEVIARKGADAELASQMKIHGVSGSLDVWVGDTSA